MKENEHNFFLKKQILCQVYVWQIFPPRLWLAYSFSLWCILMNGNFNFNEIWFINVSSYGMVLRSCLRNFCSPMVLNIFLAFFPLELHHSSFYTYICVPFPTHACLCCEVGVEIYFFPWRDLFFQYHSLKRFLFSIDLFGTSGSHICNMRFLSLWLQTIEQIHSCWL